MYYKADTLVRLFLGHWKQMCNSLFNNAPRKYNCHRFALQINEQSKWLSFSLDAAEQALKPMNNLQCVIALHLIADIFRAAQHKRY